MPTTSSGISSLWLVGVGKMGSALLQGWQKNPSIASITAIEHDFSDAQLDAAPKSDVLFFAVKPQSAKENNAVLIRRYKKYLKSNVMIVSIMAGLPTVFLRQSLDLDKDAAIVRAMPNTPCQIGQGMTVLFAGPEVDETRRQQVESLFAPTGETFWVADEGQMHAVTALVGSGPGFVFALMEQLEKEGAVREAVIDRMLNNPDPAFVRNFIEAAIRHGFTSELAGRMTTQIIRGSALLAQATGTDFAELRQNVTSKEGTTDYGLRQLQEQGAFVSSDIMAQRIGRAVDAATERSKELAG